MKDTFWNVFEDIAHTVYALCSGPEGKKVANSTSMALRLMKRSVFLGKTFRFLNDPDQYHLDVISELGGISQLKSFSLICGTVDFCISFRPSQEINRKLINKEMKALQNVPLVSWSFIQQSFYQLWPANVKSFCSPGIKFTQNRTSFCLCDCKPKRGERFHAAIKAKNTPIAPPIKVSKPEVYSFHDLQQWYSNKFGKNPVTSLTSKYIGGLDVNTQQSKLIAYA